MLGSYPIATRPLATLGGAKNIVEATMTTTLSATVAAVGAAVAMARSSTTAALTSAFDAQSIASSYMATTPVLTSSFDSLAIVGADASTATTLSSSFDSLFFAGSDWSADQTATTSQSGAAIALTESATTATLTTAWTGAAIALSESATTATVTTAWDGVGVVTTTVAADFSTTAALTTAWDGVRVIPSVSTTTINPAVGPILSSAGLAVASGGSGYQFGGTQVRINGGTGDATATILATTGAPNYSVTALGLNNPGTGGYAVGQTYTTTLINTAQGSGLTILVTAITDIYARFRSASVRARTWTSTPTLTTTWRSLSFFGVPMSAQCALTVDMLGAGIAGAEWTVTEALTTALEGLGALSRVREVVHIGRVLTSDVNVPDSLDDEVHIGQVIDATVRVT